MLIRRMSVPLEVVCVCTVLTLASEFRTLQPVHVRPDRQDVASWGGLIAQPFTPVPVLVEFGMTGSLLVTDA